MQAGDRRAGASHLVQEHTERGSAGLQRNPMQVQGVSALGDGRMDQLIRSQPLGTHRLIRSPMPADAASLPHFVLSRAVRTARIRVRSQ